MKMDRKEIAASPLAAPHRIKATNTDDMPAGVFVEALLQSSEARQALQALVSRGFKIWGQTGWWQRLVSRYAEKEVRRQLTAIGEADTPRDLTELLADEAVAGQIAAALPKLIEICLEGSVAGGAAAAALPYEEKRRLLTGLLEAISDGRTGTLATDLARLISEVHKEDPQFFKSTMTPGIAQWLANADFGELKAAFTAAEPDILALVEAINATIWKYPAKVILLLSMLPYTANLGAKSVVLTTRGLNDLSPDLLTDIVISFLKELDAEVVSSLVNELAELVRKIHTGSALLGEPGTPQLPLVATDFAHAVVSGIDAATFWKARLAAAELAVVAEQAFMEAMGENPEQAGLAATYAPALFNTRLRAANRRLAILDDLDDDQFSEAVAQRLGGYDLQGAAEVFNLALYAGNRLIASHPDRAAAFIGEFVGAVDVEALAETAGHLLADDPEGLVSLARPVVPKMVTWLCRVLAPQDDGFETETAQARQALRDLFASGEA